ncbi:MAG: TetR/AcrR family transcriptional regulator [Telmatospirillum sp.]|nr:TetR/AcrR family transcriptional regulator [Telmatospirillum sp.]
MKADGRHRDATAAARRRQVLDAATRCFRRAGFHGTSIADISAESGMRPGHIYHYFDSKETIIRAIAGEVVERGELEDRIIRAGIASPSAAVPALLNLLKERLAGPDTTANAVVTLECLAEASRNQRIGDDLRAYDASLRTTFEDILRAVRDKDDLGRRFDPAEGALFMRTILSGCVVHFALYPETDPADYLAKLWAFAETIASPSTPVIDGRTEKAGEPGDTVP